jgi:hypothetical protein
LNICDAHKVLGAEVKDFLHYVPNANEESITDYLVWKWRELDKRFNYITVATHSHHKESTTSGADFEMELWLVGRALSVPLLFQAKKLVKPYDGYVRRLRYPGGSNRQLSRLLKYARQTRRHPFYALYAIPDHTGGPGCRCMGAAGGGVFVLHALGILGFAIGRHGRKVSKGALLGVSQPFHCWFCCQSRAKFLVDYLNGAVKLFAPDMRVPFPTSDLPAYAMALLPDAQAAERSRTEAPRRFGELPVRRVGVYDLRGEEGMPDLE